MTCNLLGEVVTYKSHIETYPMLPQKCKTLHQPLSIPNHVRKTTFVARIVSTHTLMADRARNMFKTSKEAERLQASTL